MSAPPVARQVLRVLGLTLVFVGFSHGAYADAWSQIGPEGGTVNGVAVDPLTPSTVYAGTNGGVFKSTDGGAHWLLTGLTGVSVGPLAVDPHTPSTLYAGALSASGGDIFKSTDGGGTWSTGQGGRFVFSLAVDPNTPTTIFAGAIGGVWKSTDAGGTWTPSFYPQSNALAVAIDPATPSTVYTSLRDGFDPYNGMFKTTNGGATWTPINSTIRSSALAIDPINSAIVYAGNSKSTDGGASWSAMTGLGTLSPSALVIDPSNTAAVYAGTTAGVLKSIDAGASWAATTLTESVGGVGDRSAADGQLGRRYEQRRVHEHRRGRQLDTGQQRHHELGGTAAPG